MLDADGARLKGIVDEIHPHDKLADALASLVKRFGGVAPRAAGRSKWLVSGSDRRSLDDQIEQEALALGACAVEPDFDEGVQSFLQKRRAAFTGKVV
ncbi:enoyl-CoA hydratase/isomerase family protein [Novosphingobium colocasiae]